MYNGSKSCYSSLSASRSLAVDFVWLDAAHAASMWSAAAIITSGDIISVVMARTIPTSATRTISLFGTKSDWIDLYSLLWTLLSWPSLGL
jgi:hypothetical protein